MNIKIVSRRDDFTIFNFFLIFKSDNKKRVKIKKKKKFRQKSSLQETILHFFILTHMLKKVLKKYVWSDCLDEFPDRVRLPNCDWTSSKSQFFPDRLNEFLDRVQFPKLRFGQVSNPNFSPTVWMNFQTGSEQVSNPNFPQPIWTQDFQTVGLPRMRFEQVSNPNVHQPVWTQDFQTVGLPWLRFEKFPNPNSPDRLKNFKLGQICLPSGIPSNPELK